MILPYGGFSEYKYQKLHSINHSNKMFEIYMYYKLNVSSTLFINDNQSPKTIDHYSDLTLHVLFSLLHTITGYKVGI